MGRNVQEVLAQNVEQPHDASLVEALDHLLQEVRAVLVLTIRNIDLPLRQEVFSATSDSV